MRAFVPAVPEFQPIPGGGHRASEATFEGRCPRSGEEVPSYLLGQPAGWAPPRECTAFLSLGSGRRTLTLSSVSPLQASPHKLCLVLCPLHILTGGGGKGVGESG